MHSTITFLLVEIQILVDFMRRHDEKERLAILWEAN